MGRLAEGERAVDKKNRNLVGRMGNVESEVERESRAGEAASEVTGYITNPESL